MANKIKKKPCLPNLEAYIQVGIDPKTGLPIYMASDGSGVGLRDKMVRILSIVDEQDAINRYTWYNLPDGLTGQMIEKILYRKGKAAFFYVKEVDQFLFLPYALNGNIDVYGRYRGVNPVPLGSDKLTDQIKASNKWIQGLKRTPVYNVLTDIPTKEQFEESCVLLQDYSSIQINDEDVIPRVTVNKPLIDIMGNLIPYMNTALAHSTGVAGVRVPDEDCQPRVQEANNSLRNAALNGQTYIPITDDIDFQILAQGNTLKGADFMQALESLDNFRLSLYGIENGGIFQKKAHMLEEEQALAGGNVGLVMQDGLSLRQEFCNRVNSIWPLGIWCEVSETVAGVDKNMDGEISDEKDNQEPVDMQIGGVEDVIE